MDVPSRVPPGCHRGFPGGARRVPVEAPVLSMPRSSLLSSSGSPGCPRGFPSGARRGCLAAWSGSFRCHRRVEATV